jgi:UPF0755 protein
MKQPINSIFFPLFAGVILLTWVIAGFFYYQVSVPAGNSLKPIIVSITPGATLKQISSNLKDHNLIKNSIAFRLLANIRQKQTQIQIGEYELNPSMLPIDILKAITTGKTVLHAVNKDKFIKESKNKNLLKSLSLKTKTLEGYLFPETYHFNKNTSEKKVVSVMLETFKKRLTNHNILDQIERSKLSLHEVITLASLIEKETGKTEERKHISSVFHNRLKKNMRLQTDPTVIYAIKDFDGNIRKKDLNINSPYNTYRHKGLPPGPIASPGLQAIIAALNPIKTNHLYFVSRKDGSHHFSLNLKEHNQAVKKYQLRKVTR